MSYTCGYAVKIFCAGTAYTRSAEKTQQRVSYTHIFNHNSNAQYLVEESDPSPAAAAGPRSRRRNSSCKQDDEIKPDKTLQMVSLKGPDENMYISIYLYQSKLKFGSI